MARPLSVEAQQVLRSLESGPATMHSLMGHAERNRQMMKRLVSSGHVVVISKRRVEWCKRAVAVYGLPSHKQVAAPQAVGKFAALFR